MQTAVFVQKFKEVREPLNMKKQILQQLVSENGDIEKLIMDMGLEYWKRIRYKEYPLVNTGGYSHVRKVLDY